VIDFGRSCSRHRPVLIDFVDRGEVGPATGRALAHLDRCPRCTEAIEATVLTITALHRMGDDLRAVEPDPDAWPRLRARITRWRRPAAMSPLAGVAMSMAIVAVLVLPFRLGGAAGLEGRAIGPSAQPVVNSADQQVEAAYQAVSRRTPTRGPSADIGSLPMNLPQEILEVRKEVHSAEPSWRTMPPI
jgi:anti-sigma factor RsiW